MADALLSTSLQVLFDRLASPELLKFIRRRNLSQQLLNDLRRKLLVVLKAVNDAEVKQFSDELVKQWLVHVKDAVYHAEDLLDEIAADALRSKIEAADSQTGRTHRAWNKFSACVKAPFATQSMESRVKEMIAKLEAIAQEKVGLGLKEGGEEKLSPRSPVSTSLEDEYFVFGRDEIQREMVKRLLSDNATSDNMEVMSIVGMGGMGKTTLARRLYNDKGVKEHFDLKAWICVSTEFLLINVTKTILEAFGCRPTSDDNLDLLQLQLKDQLSNKKFLLVLDDVWPDTSNFDWNGLRTPLLVAAHGSKIVVTSRNESVAKIMGAVCPYRLGELRLEDSRSLFEKLAFQHRDSNAWLELEPIGIKIVEKCQGLPLAVKALGRLLHSKDKKEEWEDILNSEIWHSQPDHEILPSLRLSYHHLSPPVKHCFAYCALFPQDHEFDKDKLILLWMAEGLLHPQGRDGRRMEEIGELYFDELLAKSFFQKSIRGEESCFIMHDLIHELAQHVSGDFCARVEDDDKVPKVFDKARHFLYVQNDFNPLIAFKKFEHIAEATSLRTFLDVKPSRFRCDLEYISPRDPVYILSQKVFQDILPKMMCLRVLSLCEYKITDLPKWIGNLKHLRYLDLSYTMIKKLPESVCYLCNLQTLILRSCKDLIELPSRMEKLINLRYLDIFGCHSLRQMSSHGIGQLKSLQRLTYFVVGQKIGLKIGELGKLSKFRGTLHISNIKNVASVNDALQANMKDKSYLDELILKWGNNLNYERHFGQLILDWGNNLNDGGVIQSDILSMLQPHPNLKRLSIINYPGITFPNWLGDPLALNLVSLKLWHCGNCSTLPPLGQLTNLKYLEIRGMKGVQCVGSEFYGNASFPSLEELSFFYMLNWETWLCRREFPRLQKLSIRRCPQLTGKLPEQLLSLKELEINKCPQLLMASLTVPTICKLKMVDFGKLQLQMPICEFTTLQTSEIEISDLSQWKQLPVAPHRLSISECDCAESLLEEEISQSNMTILNIQGCCFSRSLYKVGLPTTLKSLSIWKCSKLELLLPELFRCHLPVLESLHIYDGVTGDSLSLSFSLGNFGKLTHFTINNLEGLEKLSISISEGDPTSIRALHLFHCHNLESIEFPAFNLESCIIHYCSKLRSLTHRHLSVQELSLRACPELLFQREALPSNLRELRIHGCNQLTPQVDWGLQRLSSLTEFTIEGGCEDVDLFPEECLLPSSLTYLEIAVLPNLKSLDSRGLQRLTSLLELEITDCPQLQFSTGSVLQHLISLKKLQIWGCPRLQSLTGVGLQQLNSLEELKISNCCNLQYLIEVDRQHLTSLKHFQINSCPMLQSLTKVGLQHLTSLKTLKITNCCKLKYLTKERLPDSLSSLHVSGCPLLEKRCQFEKGGKWLYIAHIPEIFINDVLF